MKVPFTVDQFLEVFRNYNTSVWPMQVVFYILAITAVILLLTKQRHADRIISLVLSFLWIWMGVVYHIIHFSTINKAAYAFGALFILQGLLFAILGAAKGKVSFGYRKGANGTAGSLLIFYALLVYPLLGYFQGRLYPYTPTFGLPCPTTIFTFGLLLWTTKRFPVVLLVIPLLWSLLGTSAAVQFGIREDIGLVVSGIISAVLLFRTFRLESKA